MSNRAMPHQLAVSSGVIKPKYPAAPRQWVSYTGDQPGPGGPGMPPPSLGTGIQRDFSRRWGGDSETRFPKLDSFARAASLGAIGNVLSQGLRDSEDGDDSGTTAPKLPDPPPPSGGGTPAGGGTPSGVGTSSQQTSSSSSSSSSPPSQQAGLGTGQRALNSGMPALGAGPSAGLAVPQNNDDDNMIDAESWEVDSIGPANMYRHPLADSFKEIGDQPNPLAGPIGRGPAKRSKGQAAPDLASPALRRQQNLVSEQRRKAPNNNALNNIKGAIARFEGYT